MTVEELRTISAFLNSSDIEGLTEYINSLQRAQVSTLRQSWFEHYLSVSPVSQKTVLFEDTRDNKIICSNGISLYYINANYINLMSPTLIKNKFCQRVQLEEIEKLQRKTEGLITRLVSADWFSEEGSITRVENETLYEQIFHVFKTSEINLIGWILGEPQYKIDRQNPILYAESEVGHAYVLGHGKNQH